VYQVGKEDEEMKQEAGQEEYRAGAQGRVIRTKDDCKDRVYRSAWGVTARLYAEGSTGDETYIQERLRCSRRLKESA
jgi:hypothetical protein